MFRERSGVLLVLLAGITASYSTTIHAQNFGGAFQRRQIVLVRKLPPTGHIDGSTFAVKVTGAVPPDVIADLQSTIESIIVANDPRLRTVSEKEHPDAIINCQITTYAPPASQPVQEPGIGYGKMAFPAQQMTHVTGMVAANFNAQNLRAGRSIDANTVTIKYDQEFPVPPPANSKSSVIGGIRGHIPGIPGGPSGGKPSVEPDKPPTPAELKSQLIQSTALAIASHLVNTSEQVQVLLARGGALDDADRLMDQRLWTRALEQLETMTPFPQPDEDAYRLYDLGVVNEALGYQAEDVVKARKYLQEAAIDYGKAIDARQAEKGFLQPQTRIDTALAHYKTLGDQMAASAQAASAAASAAPASEALTNADVISMVSAKLDEANIIDTIQHSPAVNFDLSARGQIDLAKASVNGRIIAAMKQKARAE
jgi:hypothetical protein